MINQPLLLIIDDEAIILKTLKEALEDEEYRVETLENGNKALDTIGKLIPDLILLDIFMPNCNGLQLLEQIKKEYPQQKIIMISGFGNIPIAIEATKKGALDFIEKPLNLDEILSKISFLKNNTQNKNNPSDQLIDLQKHGIIGQSYLFLELIHQINQVSNLNFPLLIYGQHGTGKTLLAKYIHKQNNFTEKDFYILNGLTLSEAEVFKKIEEVIPNKNGTLFIKNIDTLNLNSQKKLLFELETLRPTSKKSQNLRIIASSCTPLFSMLNKNEFNRELFHKLNITPIEIPPLNKRRYDIPLLIDYFLHKSNELYSKTAVFNNQAIRLLRNYNWQGNIIELKTVIKNVVNSITTDNSVISSQDLLNYLDEKKSQIIEEQSFLRFNSLKEATCEFEKIFLVYLLKKNKYDLDQVSNRLNLTTVQLRDKMLKFDIEIRN